VAGFEYGLTVSNLHNLNTQPGRELIHVVDPDGGSNLELVLGQRNIGLGQRVELQGPAINTSRSQGELPLGFRFIGVGLTSGYAHNASAETVAYTLEIKATEKTAIHYGEMLLPAAMSEAGKHLLVSGGASTVARVFAGAVPIISAILAYSSTKLAWKTVRDPKVPTLNKALMVAHAGFDWLRIACPLAGTIGNAAVTTVSAIIEYREMKKEVRATQAAAQAAQVGQLGQPPPSGQPVVATR
jgi:hypothetical protein